MNANSFFFFQLKDAINTLVLVSTIVAIIYGPIVAFKASREYEKTSERRKRQHSIFYTLMRTRRLPLTQDRVAALNTIQLDFYGYDKIDSAYKRYLEHLENIAPKDQAEIKRFLEKRDDIFYDLLFEVGRSLDYRLDKKDMQKLAYMPEGWNTEDQEVKAFRRGLTDVLEGKRAIPITKYRPPANLEKFPPPPIESIPKEAR